jgi:hypothetical protein
MRFKKEISTGKIIDLYRSGLSCSKIGKLVGMTPEGIRYRLIANGKKLRTAREATGRADRAPNWKGGKIKMAQGYTGLYFPHHYRANQNGYVLEHIVVWENYHNKKLPKGWIIHHLNGVRTDNRINNLAAMPVNKHDRLVNPYIKRINQLEKEVTQLRQGKLFG